MSTVGVVVPGKTSREIFHEAQKAREKLFVGKGGRVSAFEMEWLLERRVAPIYGVEVDVREDSDPDMAGAYASYDVFERTLRVRESVMRATRLQEPESIFTICHEIAHIAMHSNPLLHRRKGAAHLSEKMCDPDWQADVFAMEFAVDREILMRYDNPEAAANYFSLPVEKMRAFYFHLRAQGVQAGAIQRLDPYMAALQGGFDF